jgi:hypothetical protein
MLKRIFLDQIPDEETALQSGGAGAGQRQLPPHVINQLQDVGDGQKMVSFLRMTGLGCFFEKQNWL